MRTEQLLRSYSEQLSNRIIDEVKKKLEQMLPPTVELHKVVDEVNLIFQAAKGRKGVWKSVIEVGLCLLEADATPRKLSKKLPYHPATIYRALERLRLRGYATCQNGVWGVNEGRCPILFWLTRKRKLSIVLMDNPTLVTGA